MALIKCPDCDKEISDRAPTCPNCGCPMKEIQSVDVTDKNAEGLMGKPGTGTHALNVGCLTLIIGILILMVIFQWTK